MRKPQTYEELEEKARIAHETIRSVPRSTLSEEGKRAEVATGLIWETYKRRNSLEEVLKYLEEITGDRRFSESVNKIIKEHIVFIRPFGNLKRDSEHSRFQKLRKEAKANAAKFSDINKAFLNRFGEDAAAAHTLISCAYTGSGSFDEVLEKLEKYAAKEVFRNNRNIQETINQYKETIDRARKA